MKETDINRHPRSVTTGERHKSNGTSLFGGAMLATVATASLAQVVTYFDNSTLLAASTVSGGYVVLGGNLAVGHGGGGTFMPGATGCGLGDGGIVFPDQDLHCFYRTDPTYSVREWGARCDVSVVNPPAGASD